MERDPGATGLAGCARDSDIYIAVSGVANGPQCSRTAVTKDRAFPAGKHSGHPPALIADSSVADGVDAAMNAVEAPGSRAITDGAPAHSEMDELDRGDHPVLAGGNRTDPCVPARFVAFVRHIRTKATDGPISPPFVADSRFSRRPTGRFLYRAAAVADERTLILVKPDAFERRLTGEV
ncbi:MAG: hypothetical protein WBQ41_11415, partial [Solirubrobacterales bacterium]